MPCWPNFCTDDYTCETHKGGRYKSVSIKEEFEKSFEKKYGYFKMFSPNDDDPKKVALWTAKWMAEMAAKEADSYAEAAGGYDFKTSKRKTSECIARAIRELAKELQ